MIASLPAFVSLDSRREPRRAETEFVLEAPRAEGRALVFSWTTSPRTSLYRKESFALELSGPAEASAIPEELRYRLALLCLHSQWNLLRPCRVRLPVRLPPGEAAAWERLIAAEAATLVSLAHRPAAAGAVTIRESGPRLARLRPPRRRRFAAAFSGGKDSLVQAGLLAEAEPGSRPLLVATTSPFPGIADHDTPRRRHVLEEIGRRLPIELVEVRSEFRSILDHEYAQRVGYSISVNELTDTFLYSAALLAAGHARGASHFLLASENEVQENVLLDGKTVQHPHFMYSAATERALGGLLGVSFGSLISPLHSFQVQELLSTRYRALADLQYSCWRVSPGEAACSRCSQCLRIALTSLASGGSPSDAGIDLLRLFPALEQWRPRDRAAAPLPDALVARRLHEAVVRSAQSTGLGRGLLAVFRASPRAVASRAGWNAAGSWLRLWRGLRTLTVPEAPGFREGYLGLVDESVRETVRRIYRESFRADHDTRWLAALERAIGLSEWILDPIREAEGSP